MTITGWQSLSQTMAGLSPAERKLANFILEHTDEIPFLSTGELSEGAGVSAASVTRFAQRLGYEGYPHLQREIRAHLRSLFAPKVALSGGEMERFWQAEQTNLERLRQIPEAELQTAAQALADARRVWIVAGRATQYVAQYAWYDLTTFRDGVHFVPSEHAGALEMAADADPQDVMLVYTIRRYAKATTRLVEFWKRRGPKVIVITDDGHPPVLRFADQAIRLPIHSPGGVPSLASLTGLTRALTVLTSRRCGSERFERLEAVIQEADYYEY